MRVKLVILMITFLPMIMKSQNATATLGNITSCAGENVLVPLDVNDFFDVGAMTIYIGYDTNSAHFLSVQNINPAIPGGISYNSNNGQVSIAYSSTEPFYITGEKLFDLSFTFLGDTTYLPFKPGTEIATTLLEIIPRATYTGSIANSFQITDQPDSVQSYPDQDVTFKVTSLGNANYQWQENTGNGWNNLQNNDTYSGVTTDSLTIHAVTTSFNNYTYRCVLTKDECTSISDVALLEVAEAFPVATLGFIGSCPENTVLEPIYAGDFIDVLEINFNITYNTTDLTYVGLLNVNPEMDAGSFAVTPLSDPPGITIHWVSNDPINITSGKLFDIQFSYESQNQSIAFAEGTYVLNSFSNPMSVTLNDGAVEQYALPLIITQPLDETVMEMHEASFSIEAGETDTYRWMVSINNGTSWTDLYDNPPYYNTGTATLTISPAVYELNGYQYACRLNNENCWLNSEPATLTVDTMTGVEENIPSYIDKVYPLPCKNEFNIVFIEDFITDHVAIFNTLGVNCENFSIKHTMKNKQIKLDVSFLPAGIYFIEVRGYSTGKEVTGQFKILKTY